MSAEFHTDFVPTLELLKPGDITNKIGDMALRDMLDHGFVMSVGLMRESVPALAAMAQEDHIAEMCPNDLTRIGSVPLAGTWLEKGRAPVLVHALREFTPGMILSAADLDNVTLQDLQTGGYNWFGPLKNEHIPGADTTTAYRNGLAGIELARQRRQAMGSDFRPGLRAGQVVTHVAIERFGVSPESLSLEAYASNKKALPIYDIMGYRDVPEAPPEEVERSTLQPVGNEINGHKVRFNGKGKRVVTDLRLYKRYFPEAEREN